MGAIPSAGKSLNLKILSETFAYLFHGLASVAALAVAACQSGNEIQHIVFLVPIQFLHLQ
jgi:hypothetical protein